MNTGLPAKRQVSSIPSADPYRHGRPSPHSTSLGCISSKLNFIALSWEHTPGLPTVHMQSTLPANCDPSAHVRTVVASWAPWGLREKYNVTQVRTLKGRIWPSHTSWSSRRKPWASSIKTERFLPEKQKLITLGDLTTNTNNNCTWTGCNMAKHV